MSTFEKEKSEIPNEIQIQQWIDEGKSMMYPPKYQAWEEYIRGQVNDLYGSMPIEVILSVMRALEDGLSVEEAKKKIECSGASYGMLRNGILKYSNRGPEFWRATAGSEISMGDEDFVRKIELGNLLLSRRTTQPKVERPDEIKVQQWIDRGEIMIYPEKYQDWEEFIKKQVYTTYYDPDFEISLETTLSVMQALEEGASVEEAKKMVGCSGYAYGMFRQAVLVFSNRGPEFWKATADFKLTSKHKQALQEIEAKNNKLRESHLGPHK